MGSVFRSSLNIGVTLAKPVKVTEGFSTFGQTGLYARTRENKRNSTRWLTKRAVTLGRYGIKPRTGKCSLRIQPPLIAPRPLGDERRLYSQALVRAAVDNQYLTWFQHCLFLLKITTEKQYKLASLHGLTQKVSNCQSCTGYFPCRVKKRQTNVIPFRFSVMISFREDNKFIRQ